MLGCFRDKTGLEKIICGHTCTTNWSKSRMNAQLQLKTHGIAVDKILEAEIWDPAPGRPWFMDQHFKTLVNGPGYASGGVYALFLDQKLVYIGSFGTSRKHNLYSGNVVATRVWTHIGSMTLRGRKLHIAPKTLDTLKKRFGDHPAITEIAKKKPFDDKGNLTTPNRISVALDHWDAFCPPNRLPLDRFDFSYIQVSSTMGDHLPDCVIKKAIKEAEKISIRDLQPRANDEVEPSSAQSPSFEEVESKLRENLEGQIAKAIS